MSKRVLVVSDNDRIRETFSEAIELYGLSETVDIVRTTSEDPAGSNGGCGRLNVKESSNYIASTYGLVISGHCKQMFPADLVSAVTCINIHPGYNPETRGWYPQVWAIYLGLKAGFTVHKMDEYLDHGEIIHREEVELVKTDTSATAYERVLNAEIQYIKDNLPYLISGAYEPFSPEQDGNVFYKKDFEGLCQLRAEETATFGEFFNRLRALSHDGYKNAHFEDADGNRLYFEIKILD
jgi:methionyl-tRNA formyltransferase